MFLKFLYWIAIPISSYIRQKEQLAKYIRHDIKTSTLLNKNLTLKYRYANLFRWRDKIEWIETLFLTFEAS